MPSDASTDGMARRACRGGARPGALRTRLRDRSRPVQMPPDGVVQWETVARVQGMGDLLRRRIRSSRGVAQAITARAALHLRGLVGSHDSRWQVCHGERSPGEASSGPGRPDMLMARGMGRRYTGTSVHVYRRSV